LLTLLLIALLAGSLLHLILLLLVALLLTLLLLTLLLLTLLLLNLLLLLVLLLILLLLLPAVRVATVGLTRIVIVSQTLRADAQRQQADTCQKPDARFHAFLTAARILIDRTAFTVRRSRHSTSESARIEFVEALKSFRFRSQGSLEEVWFWLF
jgi:membrane-bound ClpP family serine protease